MSRGTSAVAELDGMLDDLVPKWQEFNKDPPGGYYASELKKIHYDSQSLAGRSIYSSAQARTNRWKSMYQSDFLQLKENEEPGLRITQSAPAKRPEHGGAPTKMAGSDRSSGSHPLTFMNWKVPGRVTENSSRMESARPIPTPGSINLKVRPPPMFPEIKGPGSVRSVSRAQSNLARGATPAVSVKGPTMSASPRKPKGLATKEILHKYHTNPAVNLDQFLQTMPTSQRGMIEKAITLTTRGKDDTAEAKRTVERWMTDATDKDRAAAVEFFTSAAGTQLMGDSKHQKERLQEVVEVLRRGRQPIGAITLDRDAQYGLDGNLRYVRLLTPKTRRNRWQHQTWHHLPNYRDTNPVLNRSAIYTEPHAIQPRHFTIHPDWGV